MAPSLSCFNQLRSYEYVSLYNFFLLKLKAQLLIRFEFQACIDYYRYFFRAVPIVIV